MQLKNKFILGISSFVVIVALIVDFYNPFVVYADIFGNTTGSTLGSTSRVACSPFSAPANGSISSVSAFSVAASGGTWRGAIYDSDGTGGDPNTLLGNATVDTTMPTSNGWSTSTLSSTVSITSGHTYHICEWTSGATANYIYAVGGATALAVSNTTSYPTWPTPFSKATNSARLLVIYATYTASGGASSTAPPASMSIQGGLQIKGGLIIPR